MISVPEIKAKADNLYTEVLRAAISGTVLFPKTIRSNKVLPKDFGQMHQELTPLINASKDIKGHGYTIIFREVNTRLHGIQHLPEAICFDTLSDYLLFTGKSKEYAEFLADKELILHALPQLKELLYKAPLLVISHHHHWGELLKVCQWFLDRFEPQRYYIRELPIAVPTKFIESQTGVLRLLLDTLIPEKINPAEKEFEKRFLLRFAEPLVRLRFLDSALYIAGRLSDMSLPANEFAAVPINALRVLITENKMNFLTLPPTPGTLALWGGGFALENLKNAAWLKTIPIFYWGDLDEHGFVILSQLRKNFPHAESLMMDMETLHAFEPYWHKGSVCHAENLSHLSEQESLLFNFIKQGSIRLEQEKIPQYYVNERLKALIESAG